MSAGSSEFSTNVIRKLLGSLSAFVLLLLPQVVHSQENCQSDPSLKVVHVVNKSDTSKKQGTATLIDGGSGLFITARHVLSGEMANPRIIWDPVNKKEIDGKIIVSGLNQQLRPLDDWVIFKASESIFEPEMEMQFDFNDNGYIGSVIRKDSNPGGVLITGETNKVVVGDGAAEGIYQFSCKNRPRVYVRVAGYNEGDSGSPVFCGNKLYGVTSRYGFNPQDMGASQLDVMVKEFRNILTLSGEGALAAKEYSGEQAKQAFLDFKKKIDDIGLVTIIPTQCVFAGFNEHLDREKITIDKTWFDSDAKRKIYETLLPSPTSIASGLLSKIAVENWNPVEFMILVRQARYAFEVDDERDARWVLTYKLGEAAKKLNMVQFVNRVQRAVLKGKKYSQLNESPDDEIAVRAEPIGPNEDSSLKVNQWSQLTTQALISEESTLKDWLNLFPQYDKKQKKLNNAQYIESGQNMLNFVGKQKFSKDPDSQKLRTEIVDAAIANISMGLRTQLSDDLNATVSRTRYAMALADLALALQMRRQIMTENGTSLKGANTLELVAAKAAISLKPNSTVAWNVAAKAFGQAGQPEDALQLFSIAAATTGDQKYRKVIAINARNSALEATSTLAGGNATVLESLAQVGAGESNRLNNDQLVDLTAHFFNETENTDNSRKDFFTACKSCLPIPKTVIQSLGSNTDIDIDNLSTDVDVANDFIQSRSVQ